jgi:hypothetical protein
MPAPATIPTIHVVATTMDGTRAALRAAASMAASRHARVVLLIPRSSGAGLDTPPLFINRLVDRFDELSKALGQPVQIRVCLAPSPAAAARQMTPADATVVLGGRTSMFWPGTEERLAASLRRTGRAVVFVGCQDTRSTDREEAVADA